MAITVGSSDPKRNKPLRGGRFRAWVYHCALCSRSETVYSLHQHIRGDEANAIARDAGWGQRGGKWCCPSCARSR